MNPEQFSQTLAQQGWSLTPAQTAAFATYYQQLVTVNQRVNLTRITDQDEVYLKHFYDSLTVLLTFADVLPQGCRLCDVGSGAGFPSIPLKIIRPDLQVTIIDSLNKRLKFLKELTQQLDLKQVELLHGRAEDLGQSKDCRERFDVVTARAVARMSVLSEYCLPFVKLGGYFIAMKGPKAAAELTDAQTAISKLGGQVEQVKALTLPGDEEERNLVLIKKVKTTPRKYPRQAGTPNKKPL
ncbi:MAG: 16S rRNA (guanine(527)-N(7))-methyltransferase RsmG [Lactobacillus sp.]|jgi:16S rRNA (guanine527-N7)-methyltransferase|nr:16S rRNA (guanine(527)-N(7))-methyltransferase RsmG [Lactobacillus sp.]MCH3905603.1 16S rRNA (guanine(527)-N(7))-methyltransferase RsmG [Lactobacillus sp.]MCH3990838.1 16S rRNA (guanine(527)-N(7))-methyltransferase RsmG [Lactobacillus sp.]MCH4068446.1 16S rRNA (guanine(527)-N(7))-methyltransferase RsmG [Lactobacillus sp.]MCI1304195.1 16S rRNA (guanine(527)-N(7))-methyltransferase RsmG [Lactobacillus sp.]